MNKIFWIVALVVVLVGGAWVYNSNVQQSLENNEVATEAPVYTGEDFEWVIENAKKSDETMPSQTIALVNKKTEQRYELGKYDLDCKTAIDTPLEDRQISRVVCWWAGAGMEFGVFNEDGKYYVKERWTQETGGEAEAEPYGPWETRHEIVDVGSAKPDAAHAASENIVGSWRSVDDPEFIREFKSGGEARDLYKDKEMTKGTWKVFTKEAPLDVAFPLEEGATYIQMEMSGTQSGTLNFKLAKLTPVELEFNYMDRGGTLRFTAIPKD